MSAESRLTAIQYIKHHLHNCKIGPGNFWKIHIDTLIMSWLIMGLAIYFFSRRQKEFLKAEKQPSRSQMFLELMIDLVRNLIRPLYHQENIFAGAVSFSTFVFLGLANCLAFVPPDVVPYFLSFLGIQEFKIQISSDLNFVLGLTIFSVSIGVIRSIQVFGMKSLIGLYFNHPLPHWIFFPINLPLNVIATLSKMICLILRLFINMLIGDVGFLLIAAYGACWIQWLPWAIWTLFHFLVIPLQTYIFMLFNAVYLSIALDTAQHGEH